jgi:hypothetical protein
LILPLEADARAVESFSCHFGRWLGCFGVIRVLLRCCAPAFCLSAGFDITQYGKVPFAVPSAVGFGCGFFCTAAL